jgi:hypothetical protein
VFLAYIPRNPAGSLQRLLVFVLDNGKVSSERHRQTEMGRLTASDPQFQALSTWCHPLCNVGQQIGNARLDFSDNFYAEIHQHSVS